MTPTAGEKFGPYEILGSLGRGGMGLVYRAWDGRLHREVAIKLLLREPFAAGEESPLEESRERFLREARAASALNHPHICTIFDIGEKDGAPYLVMELMEGETLKERIERRPLAVDEIVQYGAEIADALSAAHARGIVHRDIKPANIFLVERPNGGRQTKVLDFGLAKVDGPAPSRFLPKPERLTSDGATVGTVAYMSPEQARGDQLDARADLFSLGVVMYEMATRRVPFRGNTNALAFVQLLQHDPEPIRDWNEAIPKGLEKIILRLLVKEPAGRYQTAAEVSAALAGLPKSSGSRLRRETPVAPLVRSSDPVARAVRGQEGVAANGAGLGAEASAVPVAPLPAAVAGPVESAEQKVESRIESLIARRTPVAEPIVLRERRPTRRAAAAAAQQERLADAGGNGIDLAAVEPPARAAETTELSSLRESSLKESEEEIVPPGRLARQRRRRRRLWIAVAGVLVVVGAGVALLLNWGRIFRSPVLGANDRLMITAIENHTGDAGLDGTVAQGLEIVLAEWPKLTLSGGDGYRAALRRAGAGRVATPVLARQAAQAAGAKVYLYGMVRAGEAGKGYELSVKMLDVASNRELASLQATAAGRGEIPAAIDRLAAELREELRLDAGAKPGGGPAVRSDVPLSREATGNVNALHAYSVGVAAMLDGRTDAAVKAFESAAALDPKFVQAQMQLAWLYGANHAEGASAGAARRAEAETGASSTRTVLLAKYTYEVNAVGDLDRAAAAIQEFVGLYPHDPEGAQGLARVLRLQGRFGEALDVAERALAGDPHDDGLYGQAEFSLIAMDRYDAALALEQQSAQKALPHAGTALTAAYLEGGNSAGEDPAGTDDRLASAIERVTRPPSRAVAMAAYGLYLDNTGQLAAGGALWRTAAAGLPGDSALVEGGPWLLAQGALDQALAGECGAGMDMTRMAAGYGALGMSASFHAGMAAALCGDKELAQQEIAALEHDWPEASAVSGYYLPDLNAAVALGTHDPQAALDALNGARPYDLISLTPYLRGLAHVALHQDQMAIVDFQTVLGHRGTAVTGGSDVYPMAEIGVARAFAASGDKANSVQAYRRFLELWRRGDVGQKLRVEAIAAVGR